jgi:maleylacetoacetate isomerase
LDEQFPGVPLMPRDAAGRARVRSIAQLISNDIQPFQNLSTAQYLTTSLACSTEQVAKWRFDWIEQGMTALEARLASQQGTAEFAHGATPTLADCCLVPQCYAARRFGVAVEKYPTIARLDSACSQLEAFKRAAPEVQADYA